MEKQYVIYLKEDLIRAYKDVSELRTRNIENFTNGFIDGDEYVGRLGAIRNVQSFLDSGLLISISNPKALQNEA